MGFVLSKKDLEEEVKPTGVYSSQVVNSPTSDLEQWNRLIENISLLIDKFVQIKTLSSNLQNKIQPTQEPLAVQRLEAKREAEFINQNFNIKKVFRNVRELEFFLDNLIRGLPDNPDAKEKDLMAFLLEFSKEIKEFSLSELKTMYSLNKNIMMETIKTYYKEQEGVRND